jgi:type II secretory pathway pseudopilin PulG
MIWTPRRTFRNSRGFTMMEILVAGVIGVLVLAGVFLVYQSQSRGYRVQGQVLRMVEQLRTGMAHLTRDLKKAAFLATPNSGVDGNVCLAPARLLGLSWERADVEDSVNGAVVNTVNNARIQPLNLVLFGPYVTTRLFFTASVSGRDLYLMRTDTLDLVSNFPLDQVEFDRTFVRGRILKLINQDQYEMYLVIQDADFAAGRVTVDQPIPRATANNPCGISSDGSRLEVAVLSFVRYRVGRDTTPGAQMAKTDLIREEMRLAGTGLAPVDGTQLKVAEYVVDLMFYDFVFDNGAPGNPVLQVFPLYTSAGDLLPGDGSGRLEWGNNSRTEKLRAVTVKLSARTPEEDYAVVFASRESPFGPLRQYEVLPGTLGAALVDSLATRVTLATFIEKGL